MPIPTRSAPKPPGNFGPQNNTTWSNNDPFGRATMMQPAQKKKPPPRPPPPRFRKDNAPKQDDRGKKPARPTELLTNLFGRRTQQRNENANVSFSGGRLAPPSSKSNNPLDTAVSLIDLSPPGSPTFTTRSNSDGVSVDSFGSDGNSNPSVFTSSGNTSQTESAFEDDFDFFGSLSSSTSNGKTVASEPWPKVTSIQQDPFSPVITNGNTNASSTKRFGDTRFFAYNDATATTSRMGFDAPVTNVAMPTIIRARPPKPPAPKTLHRSLAPTVIDFNATGATSSSFSKVNNAAPSRGSCDPFTVDNEWPADFDDNASSLPMPSIPPPAPPSEFLAEIDDSSKPTRGIEGPRGIALYDFAASQPGDLPLKQGEVVALVRAVNDDWLEGTIGSRTGIFPANFVDVVVPLPGASSNIVNALYTFTGETWEDLPFEEGAKITVLSRISDEWLYGECGGKKGQFPANYVDRIPHDLPKYS